MMAARKGSAGIVKKLIQHGASMSLMNKVNWASFEVCALEVAHSNRFSDCIHIKISYTFTA